MESPLVCAIMPIRNRQAMGERALRSFLAQTYANAALLIYDNAPSRERFDPPMWAEKQWGRVTLVHDPVPPETIGGIRNVCCELARAADIVLHFDSDDWSHPARIAEQVWLLQTSGADAAGYRDMFFWRTRGGFTAADIKIPLDESAWLYTNKRPDYIVGTSLCYWRRTWERKPFRDIPHKQVTGREDSLFVQGLGARGVSCLEFAAPRMIASIHGGNLTPYDPEAAPFNYRRVPEWDAYCRERMTL